MSKSDFEYYLSFGFHGEHLIRDYLRTQGFYVLPAYELESTGNFKGPRFFGPRCEYITPDMLAFYEKSIMWVEAKTKSAFTWHRLTKRYVTGIDWRCWVDYNKVAKSSEVPVFLYFLQQPGHKAKDTPDYAGPSPNGLFSGEINYLGRHINHIFPKEAPAMVYWAEDSLTKIAEYQDVVECVFPTNSQGCFNNSWSGNFS
jgi:hypothetical protein